MQQLAVRADGHDVPPGADGEILRDLEGVLIHRRGRAHAVGPGDQGAGADANLDQRERRVRPASIQERSEEHTSELQSLAYIVCRLLLEKKISSDRLR